MKKIISFMKIVIIIGVIYVVFLQIQIQYYANMEPPEDKNFLIVLGAKVNGTEMGLSLQNRAYTALTYLVNNPQTQVVVTGGQGPDEVVTEASVLYSFFLDNGISEDRILIEDSSTSTFENLKNSHDLFEINEAIIVTNTFHSYRANFLAKEVGMITYPLNAETPQIVKIKSYIREYLAITKAFILRK